MRRSSHGCLSGGHEPTLLTGRLDLEQFGPRARASSEQGAACTGDSTRASRQAVLSDPPRKAPPFFCSVSIRRRRNSGPGQGRVLRSAALAAGIDAASGLPGMTLSAALRGSNTRRPCAMNEVRSPASCRNVSMDTRDVDRGSLPMHCSTFVRLSPLQQVVHFVRSSPVRVRRESEGGCKAGLCDEVAPHPLIIGRRADQHPPIGPR